MGSMRPFVPVAGQDAIRPFPACVRQQGTASHVATHYIHCPSDDARFGL
jgi:hypothetical protein